MRVLLTGGAGFIGHHMVEHMMKNTNWEFVLLDRLDLSGNLNRIADVLTGCDPSQRKRVKWVYHDFKAPLSESIARKIGDVELILHVGASTHVDRSIDEPLGFVYDNVVGTANILEYMRTYVPHAMMIYFSTDEVFGPALDGAFKEWDRYNSGNPYAATKAGGEELCLAYANTYSLYILVSHCMNVFGERQHAEKFIPLVMRKVLRNEVVKIHANKSKTKAGSRFYIHARNVADAITFIVKNGQRREKYNIVGSEEVDNLTLAQTIASIIGKPLRYELVDFHSSRPGHDLRYALDGSVLRELGWQPPVNFRVSLEKTVQWTLQHTEWL